MTDPTPANQPSSTASAPAGSSATTWKVLTAVFAVAAVGLGAWAIWLNQDAQSTEDAATTEIAILQAERDQLATEVEELTAANEELSAANEQLQAQSTQLADEAKSALTQAVEALNVAANELQTSDQQVADATAALEQATQALEQAEGDLSTAEAERDQALAVAENAQLCAAGSITAITLITEDDIDGAVDALNQVAPACQAAFADQG